MKVKELDASSQLVATIDSLETGKTYFFRVCAENAVGTGNYAQLRESVVPSNASSASL